MATDPILENAAREIARIRRRAASEAVERDLAERGILRETVSTENGKTFTRFYGCPRAAWAPFMPPVQNLITGFNNRPDGGRR